jgi:hypothetical protein
MFESLIDARQPFSGSQMRSLGNQYPKAPVYGASSGDRSRSAYSGALADMGRNKGQRTMDEYRQEFMKRAEKARSGDLLQQQDARQNRYALGVKGAMARSDQDMQKYLAGKQARQYSDLSNMQIDSRAFGDVLDATVGGNVLDHFAVQSGQAIAGGARPFGGGGLMSLLLR